MKTRPSARPARLSAVALCALAAALGVAACGKSDEDQVRDVVSEFRDAAKEKDAAKLCATFSQEGLEQTFGQKGDQAKSTCEQQVKSIADQLAKNAEKDLEVTEVKVDGDKATAKTRTEGGSEETSTFVKVDDEWKISNAGG